MSKNILLVEDDKTTILILNKFIEETWGTTSSKPYRPERKRSMKPFKSNPDLVLMDIMLAGRN